MNTETATAIIECLRRAISTKMLASIPMNSPGEAIDALNINKIADAATVKWLLQKRLAAGVGAKAPTSDIESLQRRLEFFENALAMHSEPNVWMGYLREQDRTRWILVDLNAMVAEIE